MANKKATVVLLPLTEAEKKYVTQTKSNLDQYIQVLAAMERKGNRTLQRKTRQDVRDDNIAEDGLDEDVTEPQVGEDGVEEENSSEEDLIKCSLCDKYFTSGASKMRHFRRKHTTKMPCSYEHCNSKFYDQRALDNHEKLHTADPQNLYKWKDCDYCFHFKSELKQHAVKHITGKQFTCDKCGWKYKRKNEMKRHVLICGSDKFFRCTIKELCEFESTDIKLYNKHIHVTHS